MDTKYINNKVNVFTSSKEFDELVTLVCSNILKNTDNFEFDYDDDLFLFIHRIKDIFKSNLDYKINILLLDIVTKEMVLK